MPTARRHLTVAASAAAPSLAVGERADASPAHDRLRDPAHAADRADPARDHGRQFLHRAGGAGRAGRAGDRAASRATRSAPPSASPAAAANSSAAGNRGGGESRYRGARGLDPAFIKELEKQYGFDKPPLERFLLMMKNYLTFDFGNSFFRDRRVVDLIARQIAGVDLDRAVDDADHLSRLDPARHQEGGAGRQPLRRMDQRRHHFRLCGAELPVRGAADRAVRRRQLSGRFSRCAVSSAKLGDARLAAAASSIISGTSRCRSRRW